MKNYALMRFVKLNLYFFLMYSLLTVIWYGINGSLSNNTTTIVREISFQAALFALLYSLAIQLWYRRTNIRIAKNKYTADALQQQLAAFGYLEETSQKQQEEQVFKPAPPKAPALAGKIFIRKTASFYIIQGPAKFVEKL